MCGGLCVSSGAFSDDPLGRVACAVTHCGKCYPFSPCWGSRAWQGLGRLHARPNRPNSTDHTHGRGLCTMAPLVISVMRYRMIRSCYLWRCLCSVVQQPGGLWQLIYSRRGHAVNGMPHPGTPALIFEPSVYTVRICSLLPLLPAAGATGQTTTSSFHQRVERTCTNLVQNSNPPTAAPSLEGERPCPPAFCRGIPPSTARAHSCIHTCLRLALASASSMACASSVMPLHHARKQPLHRPTGAVVPAVGRTYYTIAHPRRTNASRLLACTRGSSCLTHVITEMYQWERDT